MSITDELREWAEDSTLQDRVLTTYPPQHAVHGVLETLLRIADRIDAEHERVVMSAMNDALYHANDESMAELGWVRLPKDADGKYIHFGDVLDQFGTPMTVYAMSDPDPDQGDCMLELITDGISDSIWVRARKMRHYYDPTVEDVLCDLLNEYRENECTLEEARLSEYAAKLRLAEVGE